VAAFKVNRTLRKDIVLISSGLTWVTQEALELNVSD
jgi:hypothetical protein